MTQLALQMSTNDPVFWILVVVAVSFVVIAVAMVTVAVVVSRMARVVGKLEKRVEPLMERAGALTEQVRQIAVQGKDVAEQVSQVSAHLSTASMHFSESMALVKEEVRDLREIVSLSTETAREKIDLISRHIDQTHGQIATTTAFIHSKIIDPARELAAIMAGVKRGLEVLVAPTPKQIDQTYGEDEMFIG
ncbi:MAG TPA: hypothetical protein VGB73_06750 [Pyrinomonadaceae bacterium]|jgi:uncharacterized protein YoxC